MGFQEEESKKYIVSFSSGGWSSLQDILEFMEENDLKGLNLPIGHHKRIWNTISKSRDSSSGSTNILVPSPEPITTPTDVQTPAVGLSLRQAYDDETVIPKNPIDFLQLKPSQSCIQELGKLSCIPRNKLHRMLTMAVEFSNCFKTGPHAGNLTEDEIIAIHLYTFDFTDGSEDNLFKQLNRILRERNPVSMLPWSGYLHYFFSGLKKITPETTTVYRGVPYSEPSIIAEYCAKRMIYWSGFTSTSPKISVAKVFAKERGIIFCVDIWSGREISKFSAFPTETEIVLSPNSKFSVKKEPYLKDGYTFIELDELRDAYVF
jgi:hypothetical protein